MAICLVALSGCYLRPNFGPPGTIGMQRSRAVLHDPYPSDELGPPVVGGRPRGFERAQAEPTNLQEVRGALFNSAATFQTAPGPSTQPFPQAFPTQQPPANPQYMNFQ